MRTDRELSLRLIELALGMGAGEAEVYQRASRRVSVEVRAGEVEALETSESAGYGLRIIRDGRPGFSYSTAMEEPEEAARTAIEISAHAERDEFLGFPAPAVHEEPEIFDDKVASVNENDAMERALLIEHAARSMDARIKKIRNAQAAFSTDDTLIANSRGLIRGCRSTFCSAHIMAVAEEGGEGQMGFDFQGGRFLDDVSFEEVGKGAARRALSLLGSRKITARRAPVLLDNLVAAEFLSVFSAMLSSEAVQKGKSLLRGKVGQKILGDVINITDDGLMPHGPGSRWVDDEGVPVRRNAFITGGVLNGFMYNTYTAKKDGVNSTGNAVRGGFSDVPSVGAINLYIDAQRRWPLKEMLASMGSGLYILEAMGMHTANPVSGEFSLGVTGLWVEGGEIAYPVKEAVISGNLLEFMGRVVMAGDDLRFYGNMGSPSLLIVPSDISA